MKIAIIGSGISGLGAACILHSHHEITLYEKNNRLGGHSRTIDVTARGQTMPVDTGFIVFNKKNYPHLLAMFDHYGVDFEKSDMSFGASIANAALEYGSKAMFGQKKNIFSAKFWGMVFDILKFNRAARSYIDSDPSLTLKELLEKLDMGEWFSKYYLQAMGAAIWSCSVETILEFPAATFLRFFDNHGLLSVNDHPQWYTVTGGSRCYIEKITKEYKNKIKLSCGVKSVIARADGQIEITDETGEKALFDRVFFACHADQALLMMPEAPSSIRDVLSSFTYQKNTVIVHGDDSFMPKNKACWASWVYLSETMEDTSESVALTYWMNNLQNLDKTRSVFITLNPNRRPQENLIYDENIFDHPVFTRTAIAAQSQIESIQGLNGFYFCGAYQRYGFHEDGLLSAVRACSMMGHRPPWEALMKA